MPGRIHWLSLQDENYARLTPDARGVIASRVFPCLRLAVDTMLAGDDAGVLAELGPSSPPPPRPGITHE
jgi:hypothetical protein